MIPIHCCGLCRLQDALQGSTLEVGLAPMALVLYNRYFLEYALSVVNSFQAQHASQDDWHTSTSPADHSKQKKKKFQAPASQQG